ncbi:MAG TPA: type II secretion system protein [Phycisphaerales bacterium]|nr:type II secretion system protein [Phycisphaerales bacterium]
MERPNAPTLHRAFTLIEVLVVIAVLALLISILLPAMSKARQSGLITVCLSNLRQITLASIGYASDYKDISPDPAWLPLPTKYRAWLYSGTLKDAVTKQMGASTGSIWPYMGGDTDIPNGTLQKSFRCPSHKPPFKTVNSTSDNLTSYLMNGATVGFGRRKVAYALNRFRPDAWWFWETDEWQSGWNDGSSYPDEGLSKRHGQSRRDNPSGPNSRYDNSGATIARFDGSCAWTSRVLYDEELTKRPGKLWCNPGEPKGN